MEPTAVLAPFWLDLEGQQLGRGTDVRRLRPKSAAVLRALLAQPGPVVPRATLLETVWPDTAVSEAVLTVCINELRQALGDSPQAPQYLETVPRHGYRWIGPQPMAAPSSQGASLGAPGRPAAPAIVAQDTLLAPLHAALAQAQGGTRQLRLLSGAAGLGKTTLLDTFLAQIAAVPGLWWGRGQCLAAAGEAYLPVLEALGQLGRGPDRAPLVAGLAHYAPHWLAHLPGLRTPATRNTGPGAPEGATPARMLREGAEVLEALSAERLLVLVLEDLHWSDPATLDLLMYLAQRRGPAHLLLLGS